MQNADKSGDGGVDYEEFVQMYTKYKIQNHTKEELRAIEEKWQLPGA